MSNEVVQSSLAAKIVCEDGIKNLCLNVIDGNVFGIIAEVIIYLFCLVSLQTICHDFLVPSLEVLCVKMGLKEDAAAATFISFGSAAAPIIFSCLTIFHGYEYVDLGVGAVIGCNVFGTLLIPGICGILSSKPLEVRNIIICRDSCFYLLLLIGLVFFLFDGTVYPIESIYLLVIYVIYIVFVCFAPLVKKSFRFKKDAMASVNVSLISSESVMDEDLSYSPVDTIATEEGLDIAVEEAGAPTTQKKENVVGKWFNKLVLEPSKNFFYHIIPKCTPGTQFEYLFPITMLWSLVLIFLVTYVIAAVCQRWETLLVTKAGLTENIGTLIGMLLIAFMLCIPDMRYAIDMTKKGHGYVAISNSFASQLLTIAAGFGLPTLFYSLHHQNMTKIPANIFVCEAALFLGIGVFVYIALTLVPSLIKKQEVCKLDDLRGKILTVTTIILLIVFGVISFKHK